MMLTLLLLIIGLALLTYSADRLIYGAGCLARAINVPPFIIALVVIGVGTSIPELYVATAGALSGSMDVAVGTVIGSNIINILLVVGYMALIQPLRIHSNTLYKELPLLLVLTVSCGLALYDDYLDRLEGLFLCFLFLISLSYMFKIRQQAQYDKQDILGNEQTAELPKGASPSVAFLWVIIALIILPLAAKITVDNAVSLARLVGVSELFISLTILSIGTSLPEFATAIAGTLKKEHTLALGSIISSNIFNSSLVLGVPALLSPHSFSYEVIQRDYWVMLVATLVFTFLCFKKQAYIGRIAGTLLVIGFLSYLLALLYARIAPIFYY